MRDCGGCGGNGRRGGSRLLFRVRGWGGSGRGRDWDVDCFCAAQEQQQKKTVSNTRVPLKMTRMRMTHVARLLGLEESECMSFEAWVPPTPGTNGDVLFFAIWCLPLKDRKSPLNIFWTNQ